MITIGTVYSDLAMSPEAIRATFAEHQEELRWLAGFLTGDADLAEACVIDVCASTQTSCALSPDWLPVSPAFSIIDSALEFQRTRIAELSLIYEDCVCFHTVHEQSPAECLEFIVRESDLIRSRLDTLCRFALVLCGIEHWNWVEAGRILGISSAAVENAYCKAIDALEVIDCEASLDSAGGVSTWN